MQPTVMPTALYITTATTFTQRLTGLLGTAALPADQGLHITRCNSVHTLFMRYALDVVFLDRHHRVLKVVAHLQPWRMAVCWRAASVLELAAGSAQQHGIGARSDLSSLLAMAQSSASRATENSTLGAA